MIIKSKKFFFIIMFEFDGNLKKANENFTIKISTNDIHFDYILIRIKKIKKRLR